MRPTRKQSRGVKRDRPRASRDSAVDVHSDLPEENVLLIAKKRSKQGDEPADADALCEEAWQLANGEHGTQKDVPAAVALYRRAVKLGSSVAMFDLAAMLERGENGLEKNILDAMSLYRRAADRGYSKAMVNLGLLLQRGEEGVKKKAPEAVALYEQAVEFHDDDAMFHLAVLLQHGADGVQKDIPKAVTLFRKAIACQNAAAMCKMAELLRRGEDGVEQNVPAAIDLLRRARACGEKSAWFNHAQLLEEGGDGIEKDFAGAAAMYQKVVDLGDDDAMVQLALLFQNGRGGVERDMEAAVALYRQAATQGNNFAVNSLALILEKGAEGVPKDVAAAVKLYRQASERGNIYAMCNLASILIETEEDVSKKVPAAVELYQKAATLGHTDAMYNLALLLEYGTGVEKDVKAAVALYRQAAERGNASAMCNLASLVEHGVGTRRDVTSALELLERAVQSSPGYLNLTNLAVMLLSEDVGERRNPVRAAHLLQEALKQNATYAHALHWLAVLYTFGDDGVPRDQQRASGLHALAKSEATFDSAIVVEADQLIFEAGEHYDLTVKEFIRINSVKPRTCLLMMLGGGKRGKTSTLNALLGKSFVESHVQTEMVALSKFSFEPGMRGLSDDARAEFDFKENSLRANVSRLYKREVPFKHLKANQDSSVQTTKTEPVQHYISHLNVADRPHADVIETVRKSLLHDEFPVGFKKSALQVWDIAGQSWYEKAHPMVMARGSILVFVTDLEQVEDARTRENEVSVLCFWMQLAHSLVPDPSFPHILIVGTRKAGCHEATLRILKNSLEEQLSEKVYDAWVRTREGDANIPKFVAIENRDALQNPETSGLKELEEALKAAADEIVFCRGSVKIRWLALVDKLEREHRKKSTVYFSREDVMELCEGFPGYANDERERERDVLLGLRCFASMGRLVLFEREDKKWYVFMEVEKLFDTLRMVLAPAEKLRDCLNLKELRDLKQGRISQKALFVLWDGYKEEEKRLMLRLLCEFDLLMLLEGDEESIGSGLVTVGVPALMQCGSDDFRWGRAAGEKDLNMTTQFAETIPIGLVGFLVARLHRVLGLQSANGADSGYSSPKVRADAALLRVRDGSRVRVGFKGAERQVIWKVRGLEPVHVVRECVRVVEDLLIEVLRFKHVHHRHFIAADCCSSKGGCGAHGTVEIRLLKEWAMEENDDSLPTDEVSCQSCWRPWKTMDVHELLWV